MSNHDEGMNTMDDTMDRLAASRDEVSASYNPYNNDRMAAYLWLLSMDGDTGDDMATDDNGAGMIRYGRRVLLWDDRGFIACDTYDDAGEAIAVMEHAHDEWNGPDEEDYVIRDVSRGYEVSGKTFASRDEAEAWIAAEMKRTSYWPSVWTQSDHGNLLDISASFYAEHPDVMDAHSQAERCPRCK